MLLLLFVPDKYFSQDCPFNFSTYLSLSLILISESESPSMLLLLFVTDKYFSQDCPFKSFSTYLSCCFPSLNPHQCCFCCLFQTNVSRRIVPLSTFPPTCHWVWWCFCCLLQANISRRIVPLTFPPTCHWVWCCFLSLNPRQCCFCCSSQSYETRPPI
jgi:hypothetical protein